MLERTEEMLRTEKEAKRKMNLEILRLRVSHTSHI